MKKYKNLIKVLIIGVLAISLIGCSGENSDVKNDKIHVMTTLFPQYDFTKEIVGDLADVSLLLPPGVESHSYEPTPQDVVKIRKSDVFIYTSEYMEPWAIKMVEELGSEDLKVINLSENIDYIEIDGMDDHDHDHGHEESKDPHTWLDPVYAQQMIKNITEGLVKVDSKNKDAYIKNSEAYIEKLQELHEGFVDVFKHSKTNKIIYGGHFAFGYFTDRYNLEHISPYIGFSPNAEPTPNRIVELINTLNEADIKVIYYEELVDPKVATVISKETGAKMLLLHGAHNISKEELENNITYLDIMYKNMEKLKEGLGYVK